MLSKTDVELFGSEPFGLQTDSFNQRRDTLVKAAGMAAAAAALVGLFLSVVLVGTFTEAHFTFVFAIGIGVTVALFPKIFRPLSIPGSFVASEIEEELNSENTPTRASLESFKPALKLFASSASRAYSTAAAASFVKERMPIFPKWIEEQAEKIEEQAEEVSSAGWVLFQTLKDEKPERIVFRMARRNARKVLERLGALQETIASYVGESGVLEFRRYCAEALKRQTDDPPSDFQEMQSEAESVLKRIPTSGTPKELAETICLKYRALYLGCLITATFHPRTWMKIDKRRILELFDAAAKRMLELDQNCRFVPNVEGRRSVLDELVVEMSGTSVNMGKGDATKSADKPAKLGIGLK